MLHIEFINHLYDMWFSQIFTSPESIIWNCVCLVVCEVDEMVDGRCWYGRWGKSVYHFCFKYNLAGCHFTLDLPVSSRPHNYHRVPARHIHTVDNLMVLPITYLRLKWDIDMCMSLSNNFFFFGLPKNVSSPLSLSPSRFHRKHSESADSENHKSWTIYLYIFRSNIRFTPTKKIRHFFLFIFLFSALQTPLLSIRSFRDRAARETTEAAEENEEKKPHKICQFFKLQDDRMIYFLFG